MESTTGYTFIPCVGYFTSHGIESDQWHSVSSRASDFPFQKKQFSVSKKVKSVSVPFHYWQR